MKTIAVLSILAAFSCWQYADAYAPSYPFFRRLTPPLSAEEWSRTKRPWAVRADSSRLKMSSEVADKGSDKSCYFRRKEKFVVASENVDFNNLPNFGERFAIRLFHYASRKCVQWGALSTSNPFVKILSFVLYQVDIIWAGKDKEYYVKRRAMYGPNFISATSVVVSKFDPKATAKDSLDAQLVTLPQKRGFFLGSTVMTPEHLPLDKSLVTPDKKRVVSPLHVSDPGIEEKPEADSLDHDDLRNTLMENVFSDTKMASIETRAKDTTTKKMLADFGHEAKSLTDSESLAPIVERFLIRYYHYVLFDLPADDIPMELLYDTFFKGLNYILYLFGPKWLFSGLLRPVVKPKKLEEKLDRVREYYLTSPVLKDYISIPTGEKALSKDGFVELLKMIVGVAALQGTKALSITCMTQMPKGCAEAAVSSNDPSLLRKSVLEVARLDTPVTGAHCITQDEFETKIGSKTLKFPAGTVIFTAMTLGNTDEERFECPYVFDPERKDLPELLTSFNSVGERTGLSPRICPGRNVAVDCVSQMLIAKIDAERK